MIYLAQLLLGSETGSTLFLDQIKFNRKDKIDLMNSELSIHLKQYIMYIMGCTN